MSQYRPGTRLYSAVCAAEVMVIKCAAEGEVACGGHPMSTAPAADKSEPDAALAEGVLMGKRYTDEADSLELLCVKPGQGSLSFAGEALKEKATKKLPSSD
ncbi:MAG: hypothetical protein OXE81_12785 [Gammaproteobacteria bacterium]|nr:hypothetical protein [Gammaproteobacteria bacterium]MCY4278686.1 hypothetical protein [Gammaproteobacteria bacterium]MCY4324141.1 hypothetical protein [Gammaproteobacteria bacterium]